MLPYMQLRIYIVAAMAGREESLLFNILLSIIETSHLSTVKPAPTTISTLMCIIY